MSGSGSKPNSKLSATKKESVSPFKKK